MPLIQMVQFLDALLQRDGDQQPRRNRSQVNPEILPGMRRVRYVYIKHGFVLLQIL
jgi:hypothetical protein